MRTATGSPFQSTVSPAKMMSIHLDASLQPHTALGVNWGVKAEFMPLTPLPSAKHTIVQGERGVDYVRKGLDGLRRAPHELARV